MAQAETQLMFSIVIPARNEAKDIKRTLDACLANTYEPKEIIVVDDSTDETPEIVAQYTSQGVKLVHRETNSNGCCGARNLGMQIAKGDIIVLLNADNVPSSDFLDRLVEHYQQGADWVIIYSKVINHEQRWAELVWAQHLAYMAKHAGHLAQDVSRLAWSEGFSCRREAAEAVGYIPGDFPVKFCRDYMLGHRLSEAGYRQVVDLNIVMDHVSPSTLAEYWHNQTWRGSFAVPHYYYWGGMSFPVVVLRELGKLARRLFFALSIVSPVWRATRYSHLIGRHHRFFSLLVAVYVQDFALMRGSQKGIQHVTQARRKEVRN